MNISDIQKNILKDERNLMTYFNSVNDGVILEDGSTIKEAIMQGKSTGELAKCIVADGMIRLAKTGSSDEIASSVKYAMANGETTYALTLLSHFGAMLIYYKWQSSGKVVYSIGKDMIDMLLETADSEMHLDTLRYLPVNTFYLNIPETFGKSKYIEFELNGDEAIITYTEDEAPEPTYNTLSILLQEGKTLSETFEITYNSKMSQQAVDEAKNLRGLTDEHINTLLDEQRKTIRLVSSVLFYLASSNAIIKKKSVPKAKRVKSSVTNKPLNLDLNQLGFYKGIDFNPRKEYVNESADDDDGNGDDNGIVKVTQRKTPHVRRAHWHHYWVGTGINRKRILKWLPPIYINSNPMNPPKATVVRDVR